MLATEYHASPYMEKYVLEALIQMGEPTGALARMKQRYGPIVASPLTTLPENWDGGTDNHAWSGGTLTYFRNTSPASRPLTPAMRPIRCVPRWVR